MRHRNKKIKLGRKKAHRSSTLSNLACSLIEHKRINTTLTKAKALRRFIEPLITKTKEDSTHNRRIVFRYLRNKESVSVLFRSISNKIGDRPGGYTRIIKLGRRMGDNADMAMIEFVDFNELYTKPDKPKKSTRRGRSKSKQKNEEISDVDAKSPEVESNDNNKNITLKKEIKKTSDKENKDVTDKEVKESPNKKDSKTSEKENQ